MNLSHVDMESVLQRVLETLTAIDEEVQDDEGRWHLLRVRPYRTSDDKIEGLVLVLLDIDAMRSSQLGFLEARNYAESVVEAVPVSVIVLHRDLTVQTANTAFRELVPGGSGDLRGRPFPGLLRDFWGFDTIGDRLTHMLETSVGFEFEHVSTTADTRTLAMKALPLFGSEETKALVVIEDVTARRKTEQVLDEQRQNLVAAVQTASDTLDRTQEELRLLTTHLFTVQEEERQKVARELHDDISQRLSFVELLMDDIENPTAENVSKVDEVKQQLQTLSTDVRMISHQLHPAILDDLGLSAALKALVAEFGKREDMVATYLGLSIPDLPMQPAVTAVYRIAQEALRNVARHAGKTHVKVILEAKGGCFCLEIVDLGIGFDQDAVQERGLTGLGMISMQERVHMAHGKLRVRSSLGYGTTVTAEIPFNA